MTSISRQKMNQLLSNARDLNSNLTEDQENEMICALVGHSRVVRVCLGQVTCARCDALIADQLMGADPGATTDKVIIGHNCSTCQQNALTLTAADMYRVDMSEVFDVMPLSEIVAAAVSSKVGEDLQNGSSD